MKKNIFDKMTDSFEQFHLKDSEIKMGNDTIFVSPKLKLILGWSLFILCMILAYVFLGMPKLGGKSISQEDKAAVLKEDVDTDETHDTIVPYEKDADKKLNEFIEAYFTAITACDNNSLQDMVTESSEFDSDADLKKKAEFITGYENITVYTKEGLDEGSYVAFVVANISIAGVNSKPYDIITLYIVNGARGYLINNGTLSKDALEYIEKIKGDKDIQKVYKSVNDKNEELKAEDQSLQDFYDIISRQNVETNSGATTQAEQTTAADTQAEATEATTTESPATEATTTQAEAPQE